LLSFFARLGVSQLIVPGQYLGQLSLDIVAHLAISRRPLDRFAQPLHGELDNSAIAARASSRPRFGTTPLESAGNIPRLAFWRPCAPG
jgi:hypothetical protein